MTIDFTRLARLADDTYDLSVAVDRTLAADGRSGWMDDARKASLAVLEQLSHLRLALDRLSVAAGGEAAHAFVHRHLVPNTATRMAAAEAMRVQRAHDLAAQVERERRHAADGTAGWRARQVGSQADRRYSGGGTPSTGDGDCPASLHNPAQESIGSAATARAQAAPNIAGGHGHPETTDARCEPLARL